METKKEKFNTCCPYCHSDKMTIDANVIISGKLTEHNQIQANEYWTPETLTEESIATSSEEDLQGFCQDCGSYCNFNWKKGFIKGDGIFHSFSLKEAAETLKNIITYVINNDPEQGPWGTQTIETLYNMGFTKNILIEYAECCGLSKIEIMRQYKERQKNNN